MTNLVNNEKRNTVGDGASKHNLLVTQKLGGFSG
jgi:hypothetical protein